MRYFAILLAVLATGCDGRPASVSYAFDFSASEAAMAVEEGDTVIFTPGPIGEPRDPQNLLPITAEAAAGGVRISGSFLASCSGPFPAGSSSIDGGRIILRVAFPPEGDHTCATVVQPWTYMARFADVPEGAYEVVVEHDGDLLRAETVVFRGRIQLD